MSTQHILINFLHLMCLVLGIGANAQALMAAPLKIDQLSALTSKSNLLAAHVNPISVQNSIWELFNYPGSINALLLSDDKQTLWVGTSGGLEQRNADTGAIQKVFTTQQGLPSNDIMSLLSDSQGGLWIGTLKGLVYRNTSGKIQVFTQNNSSLPNNDIRELLSDGIGGLWMGTNEGLIHRDSTGQWQIFNKSNSALPSNLVYRLLSDSQGGLWIGTFNGLTHLDSKGQWHIFNTSNSGLPANSSVFDLISDGHGGLWIATSRLGAGETVINELVHLDAKGQWKRDNTHKPSALTSDYQGGIWVAGNSFSYRNALGEWQTFTDQPISGIERILSDGQGGLW